MIRHNYKFIQLDILANRCCFQPFVLNNFTNFIQPNFTIDKKTLPFVGANSQKIGAGLSVVLTWQANRASVFFRMIKYHKEGWLTGRGTARRAPAKLFCPYQIVSALIKFVVPATPTGTPAVITTVSPIFARPDLMALSIASSIISSVFWKTPDTMG